MRRASAIVRQAGFTLIELMVALVVSTVLVGLVMSIYMRMSLAYRSQQQVSELQQVLQAAQTMIDQDVRLAGYQMPQGFRLATAPGLVQPAVQITNSATAPDTLKVFYADATAQARVVSKLPNALGTDVGKITSMVVDDATQFRNGDVIAFVHVNRAGTKNPRTVTTDVVRQIDRDIDSVVVAKIAQYDTCILQIDTIVLNTSGPGLTQDTINLSTAAPWGIANNTQCPWLLQNLTAASTTESWMIYLFRARAYRIDPTATTVRQQLSVLQMSPSGGLVAGDWQDMGIGFTDLQVATRWYETDVTAAAADTADTDADTVREWYSGANQQTLTTAYIRNDAAPPIQQSSSLLQLTLSLAIRTPRPVEGVASGATPPFIDNARVDNGDVGDRPSTTLAGVPDASRPVALRGNNVFRFTTVRIDVRNMGVGL